MISYNSQIPLPTRNNNRVVISAFLPYSIRSSSIFTPSLIMLESRVQELGVETIELIVQRCRHGRCSIFALKNFVIGIDKKTRKMSYLQAH